MLYYIIGLQSTANSWPKTSLKIALDLVFHNINGTYALNYTALDILDGYSYAYSL